MEITYMKIAGTAGKELNVPAISKWVSTTLSSVHSNAMHRPGIAGSAQMPAILAAALPVHEVCLSKL